MGALDGRRVLVVEDETLIAMLLEDALTEAGARVLGPVATVTHALRAIDAALEVGGPDAAVLDATLGEEDAGPVAAALAAAGIPFVLATGYRAPPAGYPPAPTVVKPFAPEAVVGALAARIPPREGG